MGEPLYPHVQLENNYINHNPYRIDSYNTGVNPYANTSPTQPNPYYDPKYYDQNYFGPKGNSYKWVILHRIILLFFILLEILYDWLTCTLWTVNRDYNNQTIRKCPTRSFSSTSSLVIRVSLVSLRCGQILLASAVHRQALSRQARSHNWCLIRSQNYNNRAQQHQTADLGHSTFMLI